MEHISGKSRFQIEMRCLDELVSEDSAARQIDGIIEGMDTFYFEKSEPKETGRPPFNPKDLLKLYVYGMDNGITSSRKLERECKRNIEVMWLLNGLQPDDKTICNFRRENAGQIKKFFDEFVRRLKAEGYIGGRFVAIDGTKIRANNSKRNNYSVKKLDGLIERIDNKISDYLNELDKNDKIEELRAKKAKYEGYRARIASGEVTEVSTTDPNSRLMMQGNNGVDVSYNVQTAVDSQYKLVAGIAVVNEPNDQGQLSKIAIPVKKNLALDEMTVLGDKGYYDTGDFKACHDNNIKTIVAKPKEVGNKLKIKRADFRYDKEKDCYFCPAGQKLKFESEDKKGVRRYKNTKACKNCPHKKDCTTGKYRGISRHKHVEHAERNDLAFSENYEFYKLRQQLSEHPFGTIKRTMGVRQFQTRGLNNVTAEVALIFLAYNLKRLRVIHKNDPKKGGQPAQLIRLFLIFYYYLQFQSLPAKKYLFA